jgi:putative salt-induced outer membrane protein YdiY
MSKFSWWCCLATLLLAAGARAQGVEFTNGDHLTGRWLKVEGMTLQLDSEALGNLQVPIAKVGQFVIAQPVVLVTKEGKSEHADRAELITGTWHLEYHGRARAVAAGEVATIVAAATYHKVMVKEAGHPWRGWKGSVDFGYSLQTGDQNAHTISVGMNALRRQPNMAGIHERWRTAYSFNLLFAHASSAGQEVSSNSLTTSIRQDYFFRPHNFVFGIGQLDHIQSQSLSLRQTYGGGFGRDLFTTGRLGLSVLAGATFTNEKFLGAPVERNAAALLGERATLRFNKRVRLQHSLNFYSNLSSPGQYRLDTSSTLGFQLNSRLSANLAMSDFYVSQIPPGASTTVITIGPGGNLITTTFAAHNNNFALTAGIGWHF